jgi:cytochrome P450
VRLAELDLTDLDLFANGFPHDAFAIHRREAPVWWHPPTAHTPGGEGFWSVATHAESLAVLSDAATYSSERGGDRPYGGTILPGFAGRRARAQHDGRPAPSSRAPARVARLHAPDDRAARDELARRTATLLDAVAERGACDFVVDVATELPMQAICILLGVPEADRHRLFECTDRCFDFRSGDAFEETDEFRAAMAEVLTYGSALIAEKRRRPTDDMLSVVIHAELPARIRRRCRTRSCCSSSRCSSRPGSDTTRNTASGGLVALLEAPAELARLAADRGLLGTAIEEMVRWTSPSAYNRRTATRDVELAGRAIRPGDKVVFWEASANRDERVFADSMRFRVDRDPNPHLGFGHGVHFCLGANLARLELRILYEALLARFGAIELAGRPEWTRSNKHTGLRHLPIACDAR